MASIEDSWLEEETLIEFRNDPVICHTLLWLDNTIDTAEYNRAQKNLSRCIDQFEIFDTIEQCEEYIRSTSAYDLIILVTNGNLGQQLIPCIHQFRKISAIYIYCMSIEHHEHLTELYPKINGIHNRLDDLINQIKTIRLRHRRHGSEESVLMRFFSYDKNNEKSAMELNGEFLQTQLLFDCLNRMKATDNNKYELVRRCEEIYQDNKCQKKIIEEFKKTYVPDQAVRWYTRDSFLYRVLNRALRVQHTALLFLFRFLINDIEKQLIDRQYRSTVTLYRGQLISKEELKLFEESSDKLVSIASFFSTSLDETVALDFIASNTNDDRLQCVLFKIHADPSQNSSKPFADITSLSYYGDEQEVLMMLGSIFRINGVRAYTDTIKLIEMTLCDYDDQNFNSLFTFMSKKNCIGSARLTNFGRVLIGMAKFNAAKNHFICLLKSFPTGHHDLFYCYHALGKIYCEKCDYNRSLQCFELALDILRRESKLDLIRMAYVYNSIGEVYQKQIDTKRALQSYQQALDIFREKLGMINESVAWCYNNIGIVYLMEMKYSDALIYLEKALHLKKELLPVKHPCLANTYLNLGNVHLYLGNYDLALNYYQESHEIFQTSLTPQHPSIARALRNIGLIHEVKGDFAEASIYYNKTWDLRRQILHSTHPDVLETKQDIERILSKR